LVHLHGFSHCTLPAALPRNTAGGIIGQLNVHPSCIVGKCEGTYGNDHRRRPNPQGYSPGVRFWEIDAMRGVAIITMIVYHTMWDLWFWGVFPDVVLWEGFWKYWQRFTANTFLILVGVSLTLVYRRERRKARL
jgi:hypothetical protein